jgi:PAS domain S-box-containing protein
MIPRPFVNPSTEMQSLVLESMTEGVSVSTEEGVIVYTNPAEDAMFGYARGELIGQSVSVQNAYPPEENERVIGSVIGELRRAGVWRGEWHNRRKDGSTFYTRSHIVAFRQGHELYWLCVQRDITQEKMEHEALKQTEQRLAMLIESIGDHFVSYDREWRYTYVNDAAARTLGKSREELLGCCIWEIFPDAVGNQYYKELHQALAEQRRITSEHYYAPFDTWFENHIYPTPEGVTVFSSDITARKRVEQALKDSQAALQEADRRKNEFLATLAHELRNPLAPIRQATHVFRSPKATETQLRWSSEVIDRQVVNMARLLDDLLDVSRITHGTIELRKEYAALASIVDVAVETARPLIEARQHRLSVTLPAEPVYAQVDPLRIAQLLSNLLTNAAKYTPAGGNISLTARRDGDQLILRVADTGIGIAAEHVPKLFTLFSQVTPAPEPTEGGLGIGLAIVRGIAELHGGSVEAHSDGPGRGSEFTVRLPLILSAASAAPVPRTSVEVAKKRWRILIADDNRDAADSLALCLSLDGHDVRAAYDGMAALNLASQFQPELALLDLGMPRMDGLAVARQLRAKSWGRSVRLVAVTGWGQGEDKRRALAAGFDDHLTKPIDVSDLQRFL